MHSAAASTASVACPSPENGRQAAPKSGDGVLRVDTAMKSSIDGMANPAKAGCSREMRKKPPNRADKRGNRTFPMEKGKEKDVRKRPGERSQARAAGQCSGERGSGGTRPGAHAVPLKAAGPGGPARRDVCVLSCASASSAFVRSGNRPPGRQADFRTMPNVGPREHPDKQMKQHNNFTTLCTHRHSLSLA
jgi:hypothetical protein